MSGPVEGPADLTPLQRKYIRNLWEYCRTPPTLGRIYAKIAAPYIVLIALMALVAYLCLVIGRYELAWFASGMIVGTIVRDLGMFRRAIQLWPVTAAVLDREKLAVLADEGHMAPDRDDWS
jgi:hypothetical protein